MTNTYTSLSTFIGALDLGIESGRLGDEVAASTPGE